MIRSPSLALAIALAVGFSAAAQEPYVFSLDGAPLFPTVISLAGATNALAEGDLVLVDGILLTLGPPGTYDFRTTPREDGRLLRALPGGAIQAIGAHVRATVRDEGRLVHDPLARLEAAQLEALRGVRIGAWCEDTVSRLGGLDLAKCAVQVDHGAGRARALPALPAGVRYLKLGGDTSPAFQDVAALQHLTALRYLSVNARAVPLGLLAGASALCVLDLDRSAVSELEVLGRLPVLRSLDFGHCRGIDNVAPLTACVALRELSLGGTEVVDLAPLRALSALRFLDLSDTPVVDLSALGGSSLIEIVAGGTLVATLPQERLTALARLALYSAPVSDAEVARFAALHPDAAIDHRWRAGLLRAGATATRMRVRTTHPIPADRRVLLELDGAASVRAFLDSVEIDEAASGRHCLCPGTVSIELLDTAGRVVATLDLHHGQALRWSGEWPGDGALTSRAGEALCRVLADHGLDAPLSDLLEVRTLEARRRLWLRYVAILPPNSARSLSRAKTGADVVAALGLVAEAHARGALVARMYGANLASWNEGGDAVDDALADMLSALPPEELARTLTEACADTDGLAGSARILYRDDAAWRALDRPAVESLVGRTAEWALGHPQAINRARTIAVLRRIGGDAARDALRGVLAGRILPRPLPEDAPLASGGMATFAAIDGDVESGTSDRAHAAWALARLGDRDSLEAIRELAVSAAGEDRRLLVRAIARLDRPPD